MKTDIELWWDQVLKSVDTVWHSLGPQEVYMLWIGAGILGGLVWLFIAYRVIRRALGHRKFMGTWYNAVQFQELINVLAEDQARGHRVMRHEEIELLRRWQFGNSVKPIFGKQRNSYYS